MPLFDRDGSQMMLSAAGQNFMQHAQCIVAEAEIAAEQMASLSRGRRGSIRVGLNALAAQIPVVPKLLQKVRGQLPELDFKLMFAWTEDQLPKLKEGLLDFGFVFIQPQTDPAFDFLKLQAQHYMLATALDHPLAHRKSVALADLKEEAFIFQARAFNPRTYDQQIAACAAAGLAPRIVHEFHDEDTQLAMTAAGMGITFALHAASTRRWRRAVAFIPIDDLDVTIHFGLIWRKSPHNPHAARVIETFRQAAGQQG
jgi:DNA-binding transcriptional LysR family regulator